MADFVAAKTSHDTKIPLHQFPSITKLTQIYIKGLSSQNY